jgi:hypothetical protein
MIRTPSPLPDIYPDVPGFKAANGASQEAAAAIAPRVPRLRGIVLAAFHEAPAGLTADEAAGVVDLPVLSVRPRVAELHRLGEIRELWRVTAESFVEIAESCKLKIEVGP